MRIQVTEKHIAEGKPMNENYCPIALAIREQIADSSCVEVTCGDIELYVGDDFLSFETSDEIDGFISDFDVGNKVVPFEFELPI